METLLFWKNECSVGPFAVVLCFLFIIFLGIFLKTEYRFRFGAKLQRELLSPIPVSEVPTSYVEASKEPDGRILKRQATHTILNLNPRRSLAIRYNYKDLRWTP